MAAASTAGAGSLGSFSGRVCQRLAAEDLVPQAVVGLLRHASSAAGSYLPAVLALLVGAVSRLLVWLAAAGRLAVPDGSASMELDSAGFHAAVRCRSAVDLAHAAEWADRTGAK